MGSNGELVPQEVRDAGEFTALMRLLKQQSGLTYRELEERAVARGDVLARSTLADVLGGKRLPRPEFLAAFVRACGDGDRVAIWLGALEEISERQEAEARWEADVPFGEVAPVGRAQLVSRSRVLVLVLFVVAISVVVTVTVWLQDVARKPIDDIATTQSADSASPRPELPSGWVRIRPVTAPHLCLTDGRVRDRRYTPLVAVQRSCDKVAPQATMLEAMGGDVRRIQWHHPDYGKGCLKALTVGAGTGLLEPLDDCELASRFHIEPSGAPGSGQYVLRVDGQGCVGIEGSEVHEGVEAVMERCVGKGGQVFFVEPAS